jgi:hypothetical protein
MPTVMNMFHGRKRVPTVTKKLPWKEDSAYRDEHVPWQECADAQPDKDDVDHPARILGTGPAAFHLSFHFHF